jgi:PAS domain S-box-containing protein
MTLDWSKLILDEAPDALVLVGEDNTVEYWNGGAAKTYGFTSGEALGRSLLELIVPGESVEETRGIFDSARKAGPITFECMRRRKDGSLLFVTTSAKLIQDGPSSRQALLLVQKDVTQLKVLRDAKMLEANYRDVLNFTPDAIVILNVTGRIVLVNAPAEKLFGFSREELIGQTIEILLPERYRGGHVTHRTQYFSQPHTRPMGHGLELFGLRADGREFPVEISLSPLQTNEGTLVMSAIRDITERKRFQESLAERTLELEALNQELEAFSATMSHDLRAPLRYVTGYAGLLKENAWSNLDDKGRHYLEVICGSVDQMSQLMEDLLEFSRSGRTEMIKTQVALEPLVREIIEELAEASKGRVVQWQIGSLPEISGDRVMLKQIFSDLLANALKYTRPRRVAEIQIGCQAAQKELVFHIRDNGVGFDPAFVHKLFGVFQRLHTTQEFEGTGLGLANVRRFVHRHGGRTWAEGAVDKGATLFFSFPMKPRHAHSSIANQKGDL